MSFHKTIRKGQHIAALLLLWPALTLAEVPASREQISLSFAPVAAKAAPAVVNIYTKRKVVERVSPFFRDPFFQQFFGRRGGNFGMPRERVVSSLGSGVIIDAKGLIITNYHVIKGAEDITVVTGDRREFAAEITLRDEQTDLALLKLKEPPIDLPALALRDSDELAVGDLVLAIGNPFGVGQTVTSGIVSATARSAKGVNDFGFFIQTDAAINPGNSGGALIDTAGRLIGVPTAIYTRSGGSNGIGFAIPANMVRAMLSGEMRGGKVRKAWLGASYKNITREFAASLGLERNAGVLIESVIDDSPAEDAGLKVGDVIVALAGKPIDDVQALRFRIATEAVGEELALEVLRDGRTRTLELELAYPPETPVRDERTLKGRHPMNGVTVANVNPALAIELGLSPAKRGPVVLSGGQNFRRGDVITSVNGKVARSTRQLERLLGRSAKGWQIELERGGKTLTLRVVR